MISLFDTLNMASEHAHILSQFRKNWFFFCDSHASATITTRHKHDSSTRSWDSHKSAKQDETFQIAWQEQNLQTTQAQTSILLHDAMRRLHRVVVVQLTHDHATFTHCGRQPSELHRKTANRRQTANNNALNQKFRTTSKLRGSPWRMFNVHALSSMTNYDSRIQPATPLGRHM